MAAHTTSHDDTPAITPTALPAPLCPPATSPAVSPPSPPSPSPSPPGTAAQQRRAARMEGIADTIAARIADGSWAYDTFPTQEALARQFSCGTDKMRTILHALEQRAVLVRQLDPATGRVHRLLPAPPGGAPIVGSAAERAAEEITNRIKDGTWAGDRFPLMTDMSAALSYGYSTLCMAMQLLADRGVVHKASRARVEGERGRDHLWRPVDVASEDTAAAAAAMEDAIRSGQLTGHLPTIPQAARQYGTGNPAMVDLYRRLQQEGVIAQGWLHGARRQVWYVVGASAPAGITPGDSKPLAVAAKLLRRMPEWLTRRQHGTWSRQPLPQQQTLVREYRSHVFTIERAQQLLVAAGILELAPVVRRTYLPVPPADGGASHGMSFPVSNHPLSTQWIPVTRTGTWLPVPTDGEIVAGRGMRSGDGLSAEPEGGSDGGPGGSAVPGEVEDLAD